LREMASVPDSASVPSAERERGIEKTDELRRLKNARNRKFESMLPPAGSLVRTSLP
jgi:hypothetical protein